MSRFATHRRGHRRHRDGGMVVVVDDEDRENEGDLVMAADAATPESLAFIVKHSSSGWSASRCSARTSTGSRSR